MTTSAPETLTTPPPRPFTYTFIPRLKHLLPKFRGLAGVEYAIVNISRKREYQDAGWRGVEGSVVFTIENPDTNKSCDCELMCKGKPIPGQGHLAGARRAYIDPTVYKLTGFKDPDPDPTPQQSGKPPAPSGKSPTST